MVRVALPSGCQVNFGPHLRSGTCVEIEHFLGLDAGITLPESALLHTAVLSNVVEQVANPDAGAIGFVSSLIVAQHPLQGSVQDVSLHNGSAKVPDEVRGLWAYAPMKKDGDHYQLADDGFLQCVLGDLAEGQNSGKADWSVTRQRQQAWLQVPHSKAELEQHYDFEDKVRPQIIRLRCKSDLPDSCEVRDR